MIEGSGLPPDERHAREIRVLLLSLLPWLFPARLAAELESVGVRVEALCRDDNPLAMLNRQRPRHVLSHFGERRSVCRAIDKAAPDIIIPCDDPGIEVLHRLHERDRHGPLGRLVARSLGDPRHFGTVERRSEVLRVAASLDIRAPRAVPVTSAAVVRPSRFPCVLKWDRSWGGQGVRIAQSPSDLAAHLRETRPHSMLWRTLRQAYHDQRWRHVLQRPGTIELQEFIAGAPANRAVLCHEGRVLAGHSVVALETAGPTEPATVVMPIENGPMQAAAEALVAALCLSGFCGFDFILDEEGNAHFLELNARPTPIAHLAAPDGTHLPSLLHQHLGGRPSHPPRAAPPAGPILLFGRSAQTYTAGLRHDVPDAFNQNRG